MTKRKTKPDPLKALRKKWRVGKMDPIFDEPRQFGIIDGNDKWIAIGMTRTLARAICRMGNGK